MSMLLNVSIQQTRDSFVINLEKERSSSPLKYGFFRDEYFSGEIYYVDKNLGLFETDIFMKKQEPSFKERNDFTGLIAKELIKEEKKEINKFLNKKLKTTKKTYEWGFKAIELIYVCCPVSAFSIDWDSEKMKWGCMFHMRMVLKILDEKKIREIK